MKLHHTVIGTLAKEHSESIEREGIRAFVADAYSDLVPKEIRHLPVVWFAEGIWQGTDFPIFEVDDIDLNPDKLFRTTEEMQLNWWIYQGSIPVSLLTRIFLQLK